MIDLRSDTVTKPSKFMKKYMMDAALGDDVFQDDPTVKELENKTARMFGHEAGLFCSSGTMTNQIALMVYLHAGDLQQVFQYYFLEHKFQQLPASQLVSFLHQSLF